MKKFHWAPAEGPPPGSVSTVGGHTSEAGMNHPEGREGRRAERSNCVQDKAQEGL